MAGGSITADINPDNNNAYNTAVEKSSGTHYDETIIARRNSVLLALVTFVAHTASSWASKNGYNQQQIRKRNQAVQVAVNAGLFRS
jgi:hypothetical protein